MGTGPIFVLCWLLFTDMPNARFLAALVPLLITVQFALVGLGILKDDAAVEAMSRSGDPREILRGPLFYGIVFVLVTIFYWKDSPTGITALMLMCGGDGLADIVGRRWGTNKLPWARDKSWIGSLGMLAGGWVFRHPDREHIHLRWSIHRANQQLFGLPDNHCYRWHTDRIYSHP